MTGFKPASNGQSRLHTHRMLTGEKWHSIPAKINIFLLTLTPIDLVSLSTGEMKKRYGFIYLDMDDKGIGTLERRKKKSYSWMKGVIASGGASLWENE